MAGIQFGQILSISLKLHTREHLVTLEVERKMKLLGHPISYVIYYQWQGHLTFFFMYCLASLFLNEQTLRSFGMNTSVYKHVLQVVQNLGYWFLISKNSNSSVTGEDPDSVKCLFSRWEKRYFVSEMVWLLEILDCWSFVRCVLFRARFPLTKLLTKIGFFVTQKGPRTHVIVYSSFIKERINSKKAGELI